jgi:Pyruvate/2-oxoacid:ferredoxin oxidoreductase delta subunit
MNTGQSDATAAAAVAAVGGGRSAELPPYTARCLGEERAGLAQALRERLLQAGLFWPEWIDARPGRLLVLLGDLGAEALLGRGAEALLERHGSLLCDGLGALALATATKRLVLAVPSGPLVAPARALCRGSSVEVLETPAVYPSRPVEALGSLLEPSGRTWVLPASRLAAFGAAAQGRAAPRLCTIAGAVQKPGVVDLAPLLALPATERTPAALVRRAGGAAVAAWVAVRGGAPAGELWPAEAELPPDCEQLLILPVAHELVARLRLEPQQRLLRARNACLSCRLCTDLCPEAGSGLAPHQILRRLALGGEPQALWAAAARCTGCGACSALCPAELLPGAVLKDLQRGAQAAGLAPGAPTLRELDEALAAEEAVGPKDRAGLRPLARSLLLVRLGLAEYGAA